MTEMDLRGNLISDAVLAAACVEFGLDIVSADSDVARFTEITWIDPVAASPSRPWDIRPFTADG